MSLLKATISVREMLTVAFKEANYFYLLSIHPSHINFSFVVLVLAPQGPPEGLAERVQ